MNGVAAKFSWECRRAGIPEVAVGNNHLVVGTHLAGRQMNIQSPVRHRFHRLDCGLERYEFADPEMVGVTFEIFQKLRMRQKVRHALGNQEIRISQIVTAGIDMEARIGPRPAAIVLVSPPSTPARALLAVTKGAATPRPSLCSGTAPPPCPGPSHS